MAAPPSDLCTEHKRIWRKWRDNRYNPRRPSEWPGGSHIMDCRTSHTERAADWDRKNREQMDSTAQICRSGWSPQCTPTATCDPRQDRSTP